MTSARSTFVVAFDSEAAQELAELIKSKEERKAIFNALDKLRQLGPRLVPPHVKTLQDSPGLVELRPRQGKSASRLVFKRCEDLYVILAVSKDHATDLDAVIARATSRLEQYE
ncbi:type II toxin-antitoxin system RelE/ParE family toxin [Solirubrobacter taibaiensis]|nr:type II toxin-antitoxin system RelE/ParE family toxin [Solirubrobacter taibaiensis]